MSSRTWCWTLFNYEDCVITLPDKGRYIVWQIERCPETDNLHLQGYSEYTEPVRRSKVKKDISNKLHVESREGSRIQARNYCMKTDSRIDGPWELGVWHTKGQGNRSDISTAVSLIRNGSTSLDLIEQCPTTFVKFYKGFDRVRFEFMKIATRKFRDVKTKILIGPPGSGKTRKVYEAEGYDEIYKLDTWSDNIWFDGYSGERVLLIDDFYGSGIKWGMFLNLLDGYPLRLPVKGSHTWACWDTIYITSNDDPITWYSKGSRDGKLVKEFDRRVHSITHIK